MKLTQLIDLLQRYRDLYPDIDPEVMMTSVDYAYHDKDKNNPEYNTHTLDIKLFETRTLVSLPEGKLFSEKGPYLNIFYEQEYVDKIEDLWNNKHLQQHGQSQTKPADSGSCPPATNGTELGRESVSPKTQESTRKQQALSALHAIATDANDSREFFQDVETIKEALEQLDD